MQEVFLLKLFCLFNLINCKTTTYAGFYGISNTVVARKKRVSKRGVKHGVK